MLRPAMASAPPSTSASAAAADGGGLPHSSSSSLPDPLAARADPEPVSPVSPVSIASIASTASPASPASPSSPSTSSSSPARRRRTAICARCALPITRQCVKALATVFHPECFVCLDCHAPVARKFFPFPDGAPAPDEGTPPPHVLCETDYFRRLGLLCTGCGRALRGRYVSALGRKYHVEHFTCSLCATPFGPGDSYYEHEGNVVCSFHYSTRYATPCSGCHAAILTQYIELNRSNVDEHWHPQCYMINKSWDVTLAPPGESSCRPPQQVEASETPASLAEKQRKTEDRAYRIWTVLSAFEESSAAGISAMLQFVSHGQFLQGIQAALTFLLHVEVLFACLDKIDAAQVEAVRGLHLPQAKLLSKKIVTFLSLLSPDPKVKPTTAILSAQVFGMAHDLKVILRIALSSTIQLERDYGQSQPLQDLLTLLARLAEKDAAEDEPIEGGYTSIPRGGLGKKRRPRQPLTDLCQHCGLSVEEACLRLEVCYRWHSTCLQCTRCERAPSPSLPLEGFRAAPAGKKSAHLYCPPCAALVEQADPLTEVTLLEQYTYLLRVALDRLYALRKHRRQTSEPVLDTGLPPPQPPTSTDLKLAANLDRKVSNTAHLPRISTAPSQGREEAHPVVSPIRDNGDTPCSTGAAEETNAPAGVADETNPPACAADEPNAPEGAAEEANAHADVADETNAPASATDETNAPADATDETNAPADAGAADETNALALPLLLELEQMHRSPELSLFVGERLVSDLSSGELAALKYMAVVYLNHSALRGVVPTDELIELAEARKSPFWSKWFPPPGKKRGVFGVPLEILVERSGTDSSLSWGQHPLRIPSVVDEIITAMKQQDVSVEGIFRKNGNIRLLNQLAEDLDRTSDPSELLQAHPPVQLAALLKKFLRQLPDSLLTHRLYRLFVRSQAVEPHAERLRLLQAIALLLPRAHRDTTEALFCFLRWVASFAHLASDDGSKMDLSNLATVLAPNILYPKLPPGEVADTSESFAANRAIGTMLLYQDAFWTVPPHLARALDLPPTDPRELHRRCELLAVEQGLVAKPQRSAASPTTPAPPHGKGNPLYPRPNPSQNSNPTSNPNPKRTSWTAGVPSDGGLSLSTAGGTAMLPSASAAPQLESPRP